MTCIRHNFLKGFEVHLDCPTLCGVVATNWFKCVLVVKCFLSSLIWTSGCELLICSMHSQLNKAKLIHHSPTPPPSLAEYLTRISLNFNSNVPLRALLSTKIVWTWGSAKNFLICSTELFSSRAVSSEAGASPPSSKSSGTSFRRCFCSTEVSATVWTVETSMAPEPSSVPPPSDIFMKSTADTGWKVNTNDRDEAGQTALWQGCLQPRLWQRHLFAQRIVVLVVRWICDSKDFVEVRLQHPQCH